MLLNALTVDAAEFEARTGWQAKPEGLCKGDRCVPLPGGATASLDVRVLSERLGMPLIHDETTGMWALGPEAGGRALTTAVAPDLELPTLDGEMFRLSAPARTQGPACRLGLLVRVPRRPARVAGAAYRVASQGFGDRYRRARHGRRGGSAAMDRSGPARASVTDRSGPHHWTSCSASSTCRTACGSTSKGILGASRRTGRPPGREPKRVAGRQRPRFDTPQRPSRHAQRGVGKILAESGGATWPRCATGWSAGSGLAGTPSPRTRSWSDRSHARPEQARRRGGSSSSGPVPGWREGHRDAAVGWFRESQPPPS